MSADRVIYKYQIQEDTATHTVIPMHTSSKIVLIAHVEEWVFPAIWVEHLTSELKQTEEDYTVTVHGTGHMVPNDGRAWLGSAVCGQFVWHLYGWWGDTKTPGTYADAPMRKAGTR